MHRSVKTGAGRQEYELVQTTRRDVAFRVLPGGKLRVYAPRSLPLREADRLVAANWAQIEQALRQMKRYEDERDAKYDMKDGMTFPLEGCTVTLRVRQAPKKTCEFAGGEVLVSLPDPSPEAVKQALRDGLIDRFRERLAERLEHYIPLIGRAPNRVAVRQQKTRWGSCSTQHNLNFNWLLIMSPPEALDYVVIHELCHLYEFNHSPAFWARVARYQSEYAYWRQWLRSGWARLTF